MFAVVDESSRRHRVHFSGQLPIIETDLDKWGVWVEQQAADVGRLGIALALRWDESEVLVAPGDAPTGVELVGPSIEVDVGSRIRERVSHKARQVESAPAAWLWVENHGAVDLLSPVASASLPDQLDAYRALLFDAAAATASVQGLTFSSAGRRRWPPVTPEHVVTGVNRAAVHPVPLDRARTTYHLPGVDGPVSSVMWRLVEQDSTWLDVALMKLGSPSVAKLVKTA
ncbi:hypothetical protein [Nocardioides plantarum]|nr:hypothetical protein [Nocardioides plantarum]